MIVLMCPHCGGKVERTDDRQYALKCPYCGGEVSFEAIRSNVEYNDLRDINVRMQQDDVSIPKQICRKSGTDHVFIVKLFV